MLPDVSSSCFVVCDFKTPSSMQNLTNTKTKIACETQTCSGLNINGQREEMISLSNNVSDRLVTSLTESD